MTQPYSQVALVYACVNAIADNIANVPLLFYAGSRKDRKLVEDDPLNVLPETPNPMMSGGELIKATMTFLSTSDSAAFKSPQKKHLVKNVLFLSAIQAL
ncbi:MAG: phage portal protein [Desulfobaccales bacterium]